MPSYTARHEVSSLGFDEQHGLQRVEPVGDAQLGCDGPLPNRIIVVLVACAERKGGDEEQYDVFSHGFPCRFICINGDNRLILHGIYAKNGQVSVFCIFYPK